MQAAELGLINGLGDGRFGPNEGITRAQMMQILYAKYGTDMGSVAEYAKDAFAWNVSKGIVTGMSATELGPNGEPTIAAENLAVGVKSSEQAINGWINSPRPSKSA